MLNIAVHNVPKKVARVPLRVYFSINGMEELWRVFSGGGLLMFANLLVSLGVVALVVYKTYFLYFLNRVSPVELANVVTALIDRGNYAAAVHALTMHQHPAARIMKDIVLKADHSDRDIERLYESSVVREVPQFKRYTQFIPQAGSLATLIGLLGTIGGLIAAFDHTSATNNQGLIFSDGVSVAFYNTFFGLTIAVFCAAAYIILNNRQTYLLEQMECACNQVRDQVIEANRVMQDRNG